MDELPPENDTEVGAASSPQEYEVVARKYRPQTFADLVGQEHVAKGLQGAIETNRVGHAYLFTGARGVGKTSAARILAKALNCVHGPTPTPCNECDICRSITAFSDMDVLEIDGASNNGVDNIRELRQNALVRPSRARYKIYIIDEVHMLSISAFNALLKTLEEPPEHVKFIFCTTESQKIPITILSRCQRYDFAGIQTPNIVTRLRQIAEQEGMTAETEALELIARRAAGSMRDSQSLLEQLLALGKTEVRTTDVHEMLGTANTARLKQIVAYLVQRNSAGAIGELDAAVKEGVDVGQLIDQLLGLLRDCMAAAVGCSADNMLYTSSSEFEDLQAVARQWGLETILAVVGILDQALARLRYSTHGRILVELALVRICKLDDLDNLATWIGRLAAGQVPSGPSGTQPARSLPAPPVQTSSPMPPRNASPVASPSLSSLPDAKKKADLNRDLNSGTSQESIEAANAALDEEAPEGVQYDSREAAKTAVTQSIGTRLTPENAAAIWQQVADALGGFGQSCAAAAVRFTTPGPQRLAVHFVKKDNFSKTFLEKPETLPQVEKALAEATGERVRVEFALDEDGPEAGDKPPEPRRPASNRQRLLEKSQHPLVKHALELFRATAVRVEEPEV